MSVEIDLFGLDLRPRLPRRHRLVEQRHDLVELIHRGLRNQREQDRILALILPPLEGLIRYFTLTGADEAFVPVSARSRSAAS